MKTIKWISIIAIVCLFEGQACLAQEELISSCQQSDSAYRKPLEKVLQEIAARFQVRLKVPEELVKGKVLAYAAWRIYPWSVETSLSNVLAPFDLKWVLEQEGVYKIKTYEYARRTPADGAAFLQYLSGLYRDKASWEARKKQLRTEIWEALDLNPMPKAPGTPPIITNRRQYEGYTVENVALEVLPGVYTMGSVYKPVTARSCPVI
jgi:hypothetical protein